jgi:putative ABC transport system substrate-binding protein
MDRRRFLLTSLAGAIAAPLAAEAQRPAKVPTLGLLYPSPSSGPEGAALDFFSARLKKRGWIVGETVALENASAEGREDRLPALAEALVAKRVDVIWAAGPEAAVAAARATKTIPIVFYRVAYPVEQGLVDSLARPGRNVTGHASLAGAESIKGMEILREIVPGATRLAAIAVATVVRTVLGGEYRGGRQVIDSAMASLGFEARTYWVSNREDFDAVFAAIIDARAQAILVDFTALTIRERQRIVDFSNRNRLPGVFGASEFVKGAASSPMARIAWG